MFCNGNPKRGAQTKKQMLETRHSGHEYRGGDRFALERWFIYLFILLNDGDSDKKRAPRTEPSSRGQADEGTCAGVLVTARASSSTKAVLHVSAMLILYVHSTFLLCNSNVAFRIQFIDHSLFCTAWTNSGEQNRHFSLAERQGGNNTVRRGTLDQCWRLIYH